jgi:hypothetical protein
LSGQSLSAASLRCDQVGRSTVITQSTSRAALGSGCPGPTTGDWFLRHAGAGERGAQPGKSDAHSMGHCRRGGRRRGRDGSRPDHLGERPRQRWREGRAVEYSARRVLNGRRTSIEGSATIHGRPGRFGVRRLTSGTGVRGDMLGHSEATRIDRPRDQDGSVERDNCQQSPGADVVAKEHDGVRFRRELSNRRSKYRPRPGRADRGRPGDSKVVLVGAQPGAAGVADRVVDGPCFQRCS